MPQVSFAADIKPLFRAIDISLMKRFNVELDNYTSTGRTTDTSRNIDPPAAERVVIVTGCGGRQGAHLQYLTNR